MSKLKAAAQVPKKTNRADDRADRRNGVADGGQDLTLDVLLNLQLHLGVVLSDVTLQLQTGTLTNEIRLLLVGFERD